MPRTTYTPSLPGLFADEDLDTVINWGLGADSTAYIARVLTDPARYGINLERTAVLYMATGSEWPETRLLVEEFMLPLLREHGVRFVQLARNGHLVEDGFTVLDDSRSPERLFVRGPWTLWDDLESVGTVPQQAGTRKCSLWAKGAVGDWWLAQIFGKSRPFRQIMGFNADEAGRRFKDETSSKLPGRTGEYPLIDWGWGRQQVEDYLLKRFGVHWPKSYCTFCCFPISMGSRAAHLERMRSHPDIAGEVLRLEYTRDEPQPEREAVQDAHPSGVLRPLPAEGQGLPGGVRARARHAVGALPRPPPVPAVLRRLRQAAPGAALHRARRPRAPAAAGPAADLEGRTPRLRRRTRPAVRARPLLGPSPRHGVADGGGTVRHRPRAHDQQARPELRGGVAGPPLRHRHATPAHLRRLRPPHPLWKDLPCPYASSHRPTAPSTRCTVLYLATPSGADVRAAMQAGLLGCITTPAQGNVIPPGALHACDNGKFGKGWPSEQGWFAWLTTTVDRYGPDRCLWAVAPDVPMDAAATLAESLPWLEPIRALVIPVAFAAQDGSEHGLIPWNSIDVLFLAGSTAWKTSPAAHRLALEARERGLAVHMGRVNSRRRLRIAQAFGCTSCDGTYLAFGPDTNLPRLLAWMNELHATPTLFGDDT